MKRTLAILLAPILFLTLNALVLFGAAGRWDLPFFWACIGVYAGFMIAAFLTIDPDLRKERIRPGPGGKDRLTRWFLLPFILFHWIVAGLDVGRYHWSDIVPSGVQIASIVGFAMGLGLTLWAMAVNRFFSPVVRIQSERGHHLITAGPYRYVRHPGYVGAFLACLCGGLTLGSCLAMAPLAAFAVALVRRTLVEDRYLIGNLDGYKEYAERVRYRIIPGIW